MRAIVIALITAFAAVSVPASAQQPYSTYTGPPEGVYIDGRTPVDQRTRDLVDAYLIHKELLDQEEAERRERLQLFIYQDNIHSEHPYGRF